MKQQKLFYPEYMTKRRPRIPRWLCRTTIDWMLGRMSPSLMLMVWSNEDKGKARELAKFEDQRRKYMCWKRQLDREEWKTLYKHYRLKKRYYLLEGQQVTGKLKIIIKGSRRSNERGEQT